ncbi:hypothetical protein LAZ29_00755 [Cereibacter sphaeroides]|uniref:hypothetical protein n=1 Tax=Cereibacter sphaeroides TaxID=1063 RepID=UPI001F18293E|nr:hypothetical protein [Cereibacter sphaeroides]MCE6949488.1 hypothetical protein [Cereibacter sphaeroides]
MAKPPKLNIVSSNATNRAFNVLVNSASSDALKAEKADRERRAAIAAMLDVWLEKQPETVRTDFFATLEIAATASARKKIASHTLRPEGVSDIVELELKRLAEEAERKAAEKAAEAAREAAAHIDDAAPQAVAAKA